jgi:hypothetical protein
VCVTKRKFVFVGAVVIDGRWECSNLAKKEAVTSESD